jgi:hypothetical protein
MYIEIKTLRITVAALYILSTDALRKMQDTVWKFKILELFGSEEQAMEAPGFVGPNRSPL